MKKEFKLSEKVWDECDESCIKIDFVKEFIELLKEDINKFEIGNTGKVSLISLLKRIDKLVGDLK